MNTYLKKLKSEINLFFREAMFSKRAFIETIYFGGGTPTTCARQNWLDMFDTIRNAFLLKEETEVTTEASPSDITPGLLGFLRGLGVNRISLGVQSLSEVALESMGRFQKTAQVRDAVRAAADAIGNVSIDLLIGIPGVSLDQFKKTISEVITWPLSHVSLYFFTLHDGTELARRVLDGEEQMPQDSLFCDSYSFANAALLAAGFHRYEISNFALPGRESRHNKMYWKLASYKGFGASASSFDGLARFRNVSKLESYLAAEQINDFVESYETLDFRSRLIEEIMLGMRMAEGMEEEFLYRLARQEIVGGEKTFSDTLIILEEGGFIERRKGRVFLTTSGLMVENEVVSVLVSSLNL